MLLGMKPIYFIYRGIVGYSCSATLEHKGFSLLYANHCGRMMSLLGNDVDQEFSPARECQQGGGGSDQYSMMIGAAPVLEKGDFIGVPVGVWPNNQGRTTVMFLKVLAIKNRNLCATLHHHMLLLEFEEFEVCCGADSDLDVVLPGGAVIGAVE